MGRGSSSAGGVTESNERPLGDNSNGNGNDRDPITVQPFRMNPENLPEALGTKGKKMSINDALEGANPFYETGAEGNFQENCQRYIVAYEARRRGYDVIAQPTFAGDDMPTVGNWKTAFNGAESVHIGTTSPTKTQQNLEAKMREYGNGARGVVSIPGHVFNVENQGGKIRYVDAQTNTVYNSNNVFKRVGRNSTSITLTRTDNLSFNDGAKRAITPVTETMRRIGRTKNTR